MGHDGGVTPRVGVVILPEQRWAQSRHTWRRAEEYGFAHAWTYDHLAWRSLADGPWFGAVPTLTAAASVTSRIRLGTFVASPNFRHPVPFAKDVMTLDDVSAGRFVLGLGAGGTGFDATVLGGEVLSPRERAARLEDFVRTLDLLLRHERTDHDGTHYTVRDARMIPGCVQQPRVPFVIAANGPRTLALAARLGQGWVTIGRTAPEDGLDAWWADVTRLSVACTEALVEAGRDPLTLDRYLSVDASGTPALTSVDCFEDALGRAQGLGFTDVVVHWPRAEGVYAASETVLEEVASRLGAREDASS